MQIDAATRRNLELTRSLSGGRDGSLLATVDRTVTGPGARLLETRLNGPSADVDLIRARQAAVAWFHEDADLGREVTALLRKVPDLERALSRIALDRGGPRDLAAIRDGIAQAAGIQAALDGDLAEVLAMAREEAARLHHEYVGTEHILLGLIREGEGVAAAVLQNLSVDLEEVQQKIDRYRGQL